LGWPFGEIALSKRFDELENALMEFYGNINARRMGVPGVQIGEKPRAVIYQEQFDDYGVLPNAGGTLDQPNILMKEMRLVKRIRDLFEQSFLASRTQGK
jgi:hypothetical protein